MTKLHAIVSLLVIAAACAVQVSAQVQDAAQSDAAGSQVVGERAAENGESQQREAKVELTPEGLYNRAVRAAAEGEVEDARRDFSRVDAQVARGEVARRARYNLGLLAYQGAMNQIEEGKLPEAIDGLRVAEQHFRRALALSPDDQATRKNIEIVQLMRAAMQEQQQEQDQQQPQDQQQDQDQQDQDQDQDQQQQDQSDQEQQQQNQDEQSQDEQDQENQDQSEQQQQSEGEQDQQSEDQQQQSQGEQSQDEQQQSQSGQQDQSSSQGGDQQQEPRTAVERQGDAEQVIARLLQQEQENAELLRQLRMRTQRQPRPTRKDW